ncbi:GntR family transcriptional regulator [Bowmanella denitrificans]|uniref:GntR family transcriptional regulator n=1 Tax=Bowmanella denitrificans TaxID=366582 RepID=UPI000C9C120F|nr:GntR family transcriptional regulator [Bowmanella denitrificans]
MHTFPKQLPPNLDDATPLYRQLAAHIRQLIADGVVKSGQALPAERELMEISGTSRVTVRKALEQLIDEGLLVRRQGAGTFIAPSREQSGQRLTGFSADAKSRGESPSSVWLVKSLANATEDEAKHLGLNEGEPVMRFSRLRLSDGEPLAIEHAVIPGNTLPSPDVVLDSLYQALREYGKHPSKGTQKLRASLASPIEAGLLTIKDGSEVLRIERQTYLNDGSVVEYTRSVYRGDKYVFVSELQDVGG